LKEQLKKEPAMKAAMVAKAKRMLLFGLCLAVVSSLSVAPVWSAPLPGGTLDPTTIPQFVTPLVIPPVMKDTGTVNDYQIAVRQFQQQILPGGIWNTLNGRSDMFPATTIWSYGPTSDPTPAIAPDPASQFNYPAYTFETLANTANDPANNINVRWINELVKNPDACFQADGTPKLRAGAACKFLPHLLPIDQTLHWANPQKLCIDGTRRTDCRGFIPSPYMGPVPIVTHVHGSHVETHSDGYPEAWWLPAASNVPAGYAASGSLFDDASGSNPGNLGYADFSYRNDQPATTAWYHDHALGMTRSNVYAGPAGFWLIRGGPNDGADGGVLPGPAPVAGEGVLDVNVTDRAKYREIPIVIQDRSFNADGSLFYPGDRAFFEGLNPNQLKVPFIPTATSDISPIWNPEAFFNVMVVNGVSWPVHEVAQALYRLRFLNGCNSRFLWLKVNNPDVEVYQIGAEQGFLPGPVLMNNDLDGSGDGTAQLLMALAERADVIVDFRGIPDGTEIELLNIGPDEPFGGGLPGVDFEPADPGTTGRVMKFVVNAALNGASPTDTTATDPAGLVLKAEAPLGVATGPARDVSLNEASSELVCATALPNGRIKRIASVMPGPTFEYDCEAAGGEPFGPREALLGTVNGAGTVDPTGNALMWTDTTGASTTVEVTLQNGRTVTVNVTENPTEGAIEEWNIYNFTVDAHPIHLHLVRFMVVGRAAIGDPPNNDGTGVEPWEVGYKDTVIAYPGEITTVKSLFDIAGLYVWHCHIVEHEDNEMMRPYVVSPAP
jgi:FtsP/CotA-like multicopper oxidase with cupredoxin domain